MLMSKSSLWSQGRKTKNTIRKEKHTRYSPYKRGNGNDTEYSEKATPLRKQKRIHKAVGKLRVATEAHAYQGTIERRASALTKAKITKTKQTKNKDNAGERQHDIRPEDTSSRHLRLVNYDERTDTSTLALVTSP